MCIRDSAGGAPQEPRAYSQHDDPGEPQWATESQAQAAGVATGQQAFDEVWATPGAASSYPDESPF